MPFALSDLDADWRHVCASSRARRALAAWPAREPALAGVDSLDAVLAMRRNPASAPAVLAALARMAHEDDIAARTLLQALLPGLIRLANTVGYGDASLDGELAGLAWERIRTYPCERAGSVAANVLLDVKKRYLAARATDRSPRRPIDDTRATACGGDWLENEVLGQLHVEQVTAQWRAGSIRPQTLALVVRTRIGGERLATVAAEHGLATSVLKQRRSRAEHRIRRELALAS